MAVEFPLVLYDCEFENLQWIYDREVQEFNVTHLQQLWANHAVKSHMLHSMLQGLDFAGIPTGMFFAFLLQHLLYLCQWMIQLCPFCYSMLVFYSIQKGQGR